MPSASINKRALGHPYLKNNKNKTFVSSVFKWIKKNVFKHYKKVSDICTKSLDFRQILPNMCLKCKLFVNWAVLECLKYIQVCISHSHCSLLSNYNQGQCYPTFFTLRYPLTGLKCLQLNDLWFNSTWCWRSHLTKSHLTRSHLTRSHMKRSHLTLLSCLRYKVQVYWHLNRLWSIVNEFLGILI